MTDLATTRRSFLRGLLASAAVAPLERMVIGAEAPAAINTTYFVTTFRWRMSCLEQDWQKIVRLANIEDALPPEPVRILC